MQTIPNSWWRHQMKTCFALLGICAGYSPVTGEFPSQRPVTRSLDVFFYLRLNKHLSKESWGWWFETPSPSLWRHRNVPRRAWCFNSEFRTNENVFTCLRIMIKNRLRNCLIGMCTCIIGSPCVDVRKPLTNIFFCVCEIACLLPCCVLMMYWVRNKMADILRTTTSNALFGMKIIAWGSSQGSNGDQVSIGLGSGLTPKRWCHHYLN